MGGVEIEEHLDQLRAEGLRLAAAARRADLDTGAHRACRRPVLACHARPGRFGSGELPAPDGPADVTVSGSATDIYLWVWNRPATVSVTGVTAVAERWRQIRVRWN